MKNLEKLSRNELKSLKGGKRLTGINGGDCRNSCAPGDGGYEQYGLTCGIYALYQGGVETSSCWKCM